MLIFSDTACLYVVIGTVIPCVLQQNQASELSAAFLLLHVFHKGFLEVPSTCLCCCCCRGVSWLTTCLKIASENLDISLSVTEMSYPIRFSLVWYETRTVTATYLSTSLIVVFSIKPWRQGRGRVGILALRGRGHYLHHEVTQYWL